MSLCEEPKSEKRQHENKDQPSDQSVYLEAVILLEDTVNQNTDDIYREVIPNPISTNETNNLRTTMTQLFVAIVVGSFHIFHGIGLAFSAILIPQVESPDSDLKMTLVETSWIASIVVLSVPVGNIFAGLCMESIGRLNTIKLAAIPCCLGCILIATATNFYMMLGGRILTGLGSAVGTSPAIVYITEVSRPDLRGSLLSTTQTLVSLGFVIVYAKGAYMPWRLVAWLSIIYALVPVVLVQLFVPESPVWLLAKGRIEGAAKSFKYLHKTDPQPDHSAPTMTEADIQLTPLKLVPQTKLAALTKGDPRNSKWAALLKPTGYKPMNLLFWMFLIQQFSGIYITLFYAVTFLQNMGTDINPYTASIFVGLTRFVMSLMNTWFMKRFKRRHLLMVSTLGMAGCMFVSGLMTYWIKEGHSGIGWAPVACLLLYVCMSMIGLLSIPWTMTAELFPTECRGIAHSLSSSMGHILLFAGVKSYRSLSDLLGSAYAVQWFFAVVSCCGFVFALVVLPETHGKKLTEIEALFSGEARKRKEKKVKLFQ